MKRAICELTGEVFDCKNCKVIKDKYCPIWEFDDAIAKLLREVREIIKELQNEQKGK
jgi:hypothetical protein